jgi:hypothetical protein
MNERRIESRYLCADLVQVDWMVGEDEFRTEQAVLEDISSAGGCVQLEGPVPLGATLTISIRNEVFTGYVCYCFYRDYGYFVGVRFSAETTWDANKVVPDHLTNLHELAR